MKASRLDVLLSWLLLLIVDVATACGGFPAVHRLVRRISVRPRAYEASATPVIAATNDAINRAAVWYPRPMQCLPRSAAATWLLRRRGVPAVMVIGVRKMPFYAHAWVEVGGRVVNDTQQVQALYPAIDRLAPVEARR